MSYPIITLCGSHNFSKIWVLPCINSWYKISNIDVNNFHLISDGHLSEEDAEKFRNLNFKVVSVDDQKTVGDFLQKYPNLKKIREIDLTWRKLLDTAILYGRFEKVALIDTDVYINNDVILPEGDFEIIYMREDIPAYRANWKIVWQERMVPALNAGLVIFKPQIVDFDYLEFITEKYLINCNNYWWTEQSAWACLAGKSTKRLLFNGEQVRVLGGFYKRNTEQIRSNSYKYIGSNRVIEHFDYFRPLLIGSNIVHFAGLGKRWFKESLQYFSSEEQVPLQRTSITGYVEKNLNLVDKIMISSRLFLKER